MRYYNLIRQSDQRKPHSFGRLFRVQKIRPFLYLLWQISYRNFQKAQTIKNKNKKIRNFMLSILSNSNIVHQDWNFVEFFFQVKKLLLLLNFLNRTFFNLYDRSSLLHNFVLYLSTIGVNIFEENQEKKGTEGAPRQSDRFLNEIFLVDLCALEDPK